MTLIKDGVLNIDLLAPGEGLQIQSDYEPKNKQWFRLGSEWITHVRTEKNKTSRLPLLEDIKTDPWERSLIPWTYAYAQPGEDCYGAQNWKPESSDDEGRKFYRYVTINGKYVKLTLIFKHE
jgi:hypothetical protein